MKSIITLIILFVPLSTVVAQYSWFEGSNLNTVAIINKNYAIAAGGGLGTNHRVSTFLKTSDKGQTWNKQNKDATMYDISFSDPNHGTAVGDWGSIFRTTDGGENWFEQTSGVTNLLKGVYFIDSNYGTTVGQGGLILQTTNGGQNWISKPSGLFSELDDVTFADIDNGWAVGVAGKILHTSDGGDTWIAQTSNTSQILNGINFTDTNNGIAVGNNGTILRTSDGGQNWIIQSGITDNHLYGVYIYGNEWTAVGDWGIIIRNGILQESGTTNKLKGISFSDSLNGIAVGWFGTILYTTNGGNTWESKFFNYVNTYFLHYNNADRIYYVFLPSNYTPGSKLPLMFVLNGSNGTGQTAQEASRMSSVADTSGFIVVYPDPPSGGEWDLTNDVGFISALIDTVDNKYGVDLRRVYVTGFSFGGFMSHELGCKLSDRIAAIAPVSGTILGSTISECNSTDTLPVFYCHGTLDVIVPYSGVPATLDFWIERNEATASVDTLELPDIDTTDGCTVTKYSFRNDEGVARVVFYKVINGGHNWPGAPIEPNQGNKNMDINASQEIWDFVKDFDIVVGISETSKQISTNFNLSQNYPNPFNPSTKIKYSISNAELVTIKVYDLLGQEVAILVNEFKPAGNYETDFHTFRLSSGIYFYQLQAGSFVETKKMLLLK